MYSLVGGAIVVACAIPLYMLLGAHNDKKRQQRAAPPPSVMEHGAPPKVVKRMKKQIRDEERAARTVDEANQPPYKVKLDAKPRPIPMDEEEFV